MTNQEIVAGIKQNDPKAYEHLYRSYGGKVLGYVMQKGGTLDDGKDVLQETMLKLPTSIKNYEEQGIFFKWFFTIVGNTWAQILRGRKREQKQAEDDDFDALERVIVRERKYEAMEAAFEKLDAMCRRILHWFHVEGKSSQEIAVLEQISDNNARVRLKRCRDGWSGLANDYLADLNP
jgi:RNA polymerase sigma factor (sigma-70 family)